MVIYLYRWKLKEGKEKDFRDAWSYVTRELREKCGSYGSRLHQGSDGLWYGYAQWPTRQKREEARLDHDEILHARKMMKEATAEEFPEVVLEPASDFLIYPLEA